MFTKSYVWSGVECDAMCKVIQNPANISRNREKKAGSVRYVSVWRDGTREKREERRAKRAASVRAYAKHITGEG